MLPPEPTKDIDWAQVGFKVRPIPKHVRYTFTTDAGWDKGRIETSNDISMPITATALHYGQACFEGLKAFRMADGQVRLFRPDAHARRFQSSCRTAGLPAPPAALFIEACSRAVAASLTLVPPFECGSASFYVRPVMLGTGAEIGLHPAQHVTLIVFGLPVSAYYSSETADSSPGALPPPVRVLILQRYDRAAPFGTGRAKMGGNYGPGLAPSAYSHQHGYAANLFLDSATRTHVEEFGTSNFVGLTPPGRDGVRSYVTPLSPSVLPSVTNRSLAQIAKQQLGWNVEHRPVLWSEVASGAFSEVAACGTAVILSAVGAIDVEKPAKIDSRPPRGEEPLDFYGPESAASLYDELEQHAETGSKRPLVIGEHVEIAGRPASQASEPAWAGVRALFDALRAIQRGTCSEWASWAWHSAPILPLGE